MSLLYQPEMHNTIEYTIDEMLKIAQKLDVPVSTTINGVDVYVTPKSSTLEIYHHYIREVHRDDRTHSTTT